MKVLLFGATGMVGDGVLHECLIDPRVTSVLAVGRSPLGVTHAKLGERRRTDFFAYTDLTRELATIDACFFCLGVSSAGMNEPSYQRQTFDLTLAAARLPPPGGTRPSVTFPGKGRTARSAAERCGRGSRERRKTRCWPFRSTRTCSDRDSFGLGPVYGRRRGSTECSTGLGAALPGAQATRPESRDDGGEPMIAVAAVGYPKRVLENPDINAIGRAA